MVAFGFDSTDKGYDKYDGKNDENKSSIPYPLHLQSLSQKQADGRTQRAEELTGQHSVCLGRTSKNAGQAGQYIEK